MLQKLYILFAAGLFVVLSAYAWYGSVAFRKELGDFKPTGDDRSPRSQAAASAMKDISREVWWSLPSGERQRGFYVPSQNGLVIVYAHGSPGNASGFRDILVNMERRGYGGLAIDLPGYGESEGNRDWSERYAQSVIRGVDFIHDQEQSLIGIGGFGFSMGGMTIATAAANDKRIGGIVLMSSYTNLTEQLHHSFRRKVPGMGYFAEAAAYWSGVPVRAMNVMAELDRYAPRPLMVIGGTLDNVTPVYMQRELAAAIPGADLWLVEGANHINLGQIAGESLYARLDEFWRNSITNRPADGRNDDTESAYTAKEN